MNPLPQHQENAIREMWDALSYMTDDPDYDFAYAQATETENKIREEWAKSEKVRASAPALLEALKSACSRMERAREILKSPTANWGMLSTDDLRLVIIKATE